MGAWGGGLYDSDFSQDLRATIDGIFRAPLSDDEILAEVAAAHCCDGDDHIDAFDYWLVLADQLERRGVPRRDVSDRAIAIIEGGEDLAALQELDAEPPMLARRRKACAELMERLRNPRRAKRRRPLAQPQPLLFDRGEAIAWPTDKGQFKAESVAGGFKPDGWGFGMVSDVGHLYGVLAYHSVQALKWRRPERPSVELAARCARSEHFYGRITPEDVEQLRIERLGVVPEQALGPPLDPKTTESDRRKAALRDGGLPSAFGLDAFNNSVWPGPKFMFLAPGRDPLDPYEPDQRPGMFEEDYEFAALPPHKPATRAHYFEVMREQATRGNG